VKHPLYGKIIKLSKKYHAHDEGNAFKAGEQVRIEECAPVSKLKSWTVLDRVGAAPMAVDEIAETDLNPKPDVEQKAAKPAKAAAKGKAKKAEPEAAEA
jgi:small subunit ribosomal protein S17